MKVPIQDKMPELDLAIEAALTAGREIMRIYRTDFSSGTKADDSPITEADLASNRIIRDILARSGHYILSEEDADSADRLKETVLWIVDPLDGTSDFIDRTGEFTVMVALVRDGRPVIGVINWPDGGELFVAQRGGGAFRLSEGEWRGIAVSPVTELGSCRIVGSRHHLSRLERDLIGKMGIGEFVSVGSSLKACNVGSGKADAYFTLTNKMNEWDSAASSCIVTEAGGRITDMCGNEITYNGGDVRHQNGILISNGGLHEKILRAVLD